MSEFDVDLNPESPLSLGDGELIVSAGQGIRTPALFAGSPQSARRFWEFFTAEIPNDNTRKAYLCAIRRFDAWCAARNLSLLRLQPILIATYIKELQASLSVPSVKQHLAAIQMLFDYLVGERKECWVRPDRTGWQKLYAKESEGAVERSREALTRYAGRYVHFEPTDRSAASFDSGRSPFLSPTRDGSLLVAFRTRPCIRQRAETTAEPARFCRSAMPPALSG